MKKKIIISISIIIGLLLIFSLYSKYIDSARVRNGIEPKFVIKIINNNGEKVTYWGLGYKVIRYPSVSPSEPYKNNKGVKFGNWFMNYVLEDNPKILEIVDTTKNIENFDCAEALEEFYEDNNYTYYYSCIKSSHVIVKFTDGSQMTVAKALKYDYITIKDLENFNIDYIKESRELTNIYINGYRMLLKRNNDCLNPQKYYTDESRALYLICFKDITLVKDGNTMSLKFHLQNVNQTFEDSIKEIIDTLDLDSMFKDGGTKIYKNDDITLIKCNTLDGNKDIYIGDSTIEYKQEYCK